MVFTRRRTEESLSEREGEGGTASEGEREREPARERERERENVDNNSLVYASTGFTIRGVCVPDRKPFLKRRGIVFRWRQRPEPVLCRRCALFCSVDAPWPKCRNRADG